MLYLCYISPKSRAPLRNLPVELGNPCVGEAVCQLLEMEGIWLSNKKKILVILQGHWGRTTVFGFVLALLQTSINPKSTQLISSLFEKCVLYLYLRFPPISLHLTRHEEHSMPPLTPAPSGDPHSIGHATHTVTSPLSSPSTQCPYDTSNQPHSDGPSPRSWPLHPPTPSPPRAHARV